MSADGNPKNKTASEVEEKRAALGATLKIAQNDLKNSIRDGLYGIAAQNSARCQSYQAQINVLAWVLGEQG